MRTSRTVLALALAAFAAAQASARDFDQRNEAALRFGTFGNSQKLTINGESNIASSGLGVGARYLRNLGPHLGVGVELNSLDAGSTTSNILIANGVTKTGLSMNDGLAVVRVRFFRDHIRPYLLGGIGLGTTHLSLKSQPQSGYTWKNTGTAESRTLIDRKVTGAAFAGEIGLDYLFNKYISAGAYLAVHAEQRETYDATPQGVATGLGWVKGAFAGVWLGGSVSGRF